jgi:hypothetical protein
MTGAGVRPGTVGKRGRGVGVLKRQGFVVTVKEETMRRTAHYPAMIGGLALLVLGLAGTAHAAAFDMGAWVEQQLRAHSMQLFGIVEPLEASATDAAFSGPGVEAVLVAKGLKVELVTDNIARYADMIALWPDDRNPTHLIVAIENFSGGPEDPSLQRVDLRTGAVSTILRGLKAVDPVRRTPWGTILVAEESGADGRAYEILDPIGTTEARVLDRVTGLTDHPRVVQRPALGSFSWEGIAVLEDGTLYAGDEQRPGSGLPGGALYKFVPEHPWNPAAGPLVNLTASPLRSGTLYALRLGLRSGATDYGQGNERGQGKWIGPINTDHPSVGLGSRKDAANRKATGFYRPEDMELDPRAKARGVVRICWNNTGRAAAGHFGETLCLEDPPTTDPGFPAGTVPEVQAFVLGNEELNQPDNLAFQPGTGNLYVVEDNPHGDIWACLPDGEDRDLLSDGCVRILSVRDPEAEPTGLIFTADGTTAYLNLQHRTPVGRDGRYDDLLKITGFKVR